MNVPRGSPISLREDKGAGLEEILESNRQGFLEDMPFQLALRVEGDLQHGRVIVAFETLATQSEVKGPVTLAVSVSLSGMLSLGPCFRLPNGTCTWPEAQSSSGIPERRWEKREELEKTISAGIS